jgi:small subunit ribosomal protein S11
MGKKRIIKKSGGSDVSGTSRSLSRSPKRKLESGILHITATFNNTILTFTDTEGRAVAQASSGSLGFKGSRKSTPFAAAKVGEMVAEKIQQLGVRESAVVVRGVGAGRESALRGFTAKGIALLKITDMTPVAHNGPRAPRARRI